MKKRILIIAGISIWLLLSCKLVTETQPDKGTSASTTAVALVPTSGSIAARPFPQHVNLAPGSILPNHRSQAQLDDDVRAFYDTWKATYVIYAGPSVNSNPMYRIAFGKDQPGKETTVSEGQGYGMIIVPLMGGYDEEAQQIFDGLWEFVRAHPSVADSRLMDWNIPDTENGNESAFDGDADIAYGMLLADAQWGCY